jgi:hypothetical protein
VSVRRPGPSHYRNGSPSRRLLVVQPTQALLSQPAGQAGAQLSLGIVTAGRPRAAQVWRPHSSKGSSSSRSSCSALLSQ